MINHLPLLTVHTSQILKERLMAARTTVLAQRYQARCRIRNYTAPFLLLLFIGLIFGHEWAKPPLAVATVLILVVTLLCMGVSDYHHNRRLQDIQERLYAVHFHTAP